MKDSRYVFGSCSKVSVNFNNPSTPGLGVSWQFTHERTFGRKKTGITQQEQPGRICSHSLGDGKQRGKLAGESSRLGYSRRFHWGCAMEWEHGPDIKALLQCKSNIPGDLSHNWEWRQQVPGVQGCGAFKPRPENHKNQTEPQQTPREGELSPDCAVGGPESVSMSRGGMGMGYGAFQWQIHVPPLSNKEITDFLLPEQVSGKSSQINLWVSITSQ